MIRRKRMAAKALLFFAKKKRGGPDALGPNPAGTARCPYQGRFRSLRSRRVARLTK